MNKYRTHNCNQLRSEDVSSKVSLAGWINRKRDHGNVLFVDLRDHYGVTQCVIEKTNTKLLNLVDSLRVETVIKIDGTVIKREPDTINKSLNTGAIEIAVDNVEVLSEAKELPMPVFGENDYPEEIRLKYRFLDIRREELHKNIVLRSSIISHIRKLMSDAGFLEMQTPILTASSPEGARDYLVPSRIHPGKFYALPQAPQQFKQLIMISGFDKYFQIAPCFRDEDARADRSPGEFYQLDMEMAFVEQDDVFNAIEPILHSVFTTFSDFNVTETPFPRITYADAMSRYGTDKPDLRNPINISNLTKEFNDDKVEFSAFKKIIEEGGEVLGIPAPDSSQKPRSFFDNLNNWARKEMNAAGLGYIVFDKSSSGVEGKGPIAKFIPSEIQEMILNKAGLKAGDSIFFACAKGKEVYDIAAAARDKIAIDLDLIEKGVFKFCWIVDFPMYEKDKETGKIDFSHNPFSMPQGGLDALNGDPLSVLGYQYDLACNGFELVSGAIRNHQPDLMFKAFEIAGYGEDEVRRRFDGMVNAFQFGAPPHGGCAAGIDRIVMLLANQENIREVIMFPMNQRAEDLMMGAPSEPTSEQLMELNLRTIPKS